MDMKMVNNVMYHTEIIKFYYLKKKKDITVKIEITT